jgi:hypothetical protein
METAYHVLQKILAIAGGILLLLFLGWVVKRRFIDRKPIPSSVSNATRAQLMEIMNAEQRAALEHQMHMEEDESREDDQGEKP